MACDAGPCCSCRPNTSECSGDKGDHSGPIELPMNILDGLGDAGVSHQTVIVVGAQDVQSDVLIVGDIEQSLVAKEVTIL